MLPTNTSADSQHHFKSQTKQLQKLQLIVTASKPPHSPSHLPSAMSPRSIYKSRNSPIPQTAQPATQSILTKELLLYLTNCQSLEQIQVVAIRNRNLEEVLHLLCCCPQLQIAYLSSNRIKDLEYLPAFLNIRKLDLSNNHIAQLPQPSSFQHLKKLHLLYLHDNQISEWNNLKSLAAAPSLLHVTLFSNPVVTIPGYRHFLVNSSKRLLALDSYIITDQQRIQAASFGYRFRSMNQFMKLHLPEFPTHKTASEHLFNLEVDIYRLRRLFEKNSPVILIQSLWRGFIVRHSAQISSKSRKKAALIIQRWSRGWKLRKTLRQELREVLKGTNDQYLLYSQKQLQRRDAMEKITIMIIRFVARRRLHRKRVAAATVIQKYVRGHLTRVTSFIKALKLQTYPYLYILREQRGPLFRILDKIAPDYMINQNTSSIINTQSQQQQKTISKEEQSSQMNIKTQSDRKSKYQPILQSSSELRKCVLQTRRYLTI